MWARSGVGFELYAIGKKLSHTASIANCYAADLKEAEALLEELN